MVCGPGLRCLVLLPAPIARPQEPHQAVVTVQVLEQWVLGSSPSGENEGAVGRAPRERHLFPNSCTHRVDPAQPLIKQDRNNCPPTLSLVANLGTAKRAGKEEGVVGGEMAVSLGKG